MNAIDAKKVTLEEARRMEAEAKQKASALNIRYAAHLIASVLGIENPNPVGYRVRQWVYEAIHAGRSWHIISNDGLDKTTRITVDGLVVLDSWRQGSYQTFRDGDWLPEFGQLFEEARKRNSIRAMHAKHSDVARLLLNFAPTNAQILMPA